MTMSDTPLPEEPHTYEIPAEPAPAPAPIVKKLTAEEQLQIENCFLKVQNLALQTEKLHADVQRAVQMRIEEQARMAALEARLGQKYQVDMRKVKIAPDGTIIEG